MAEAKGGRQKRTLLDALPPMIICGVSAHQAGTSSDLWPVVGRRSRRSVAAQRPAMVLLLESCFPSIEAVAATTI